METPLGFAPHNHSTLLQQIPVNVRPCDAPIRGKADADKLSEPTGVVVPLRLRISKRLKNRVRLQNLALQQAQITLRGQAFVSPDLRNGIEHALHECFVILSRVDKKLSRHLNTSSSGWFSGRKVAVASTWEILGGRREVQALRARMSNQLEAIQTLILLATSYVLRVGRLTAA